MDTSPVDLVVIVASVRVGRLGPRVADWFVGSVSTRTDFAMRVVDLADFVLPVDLSASTAADALGASVGSADAVVVVTPEYNHGYPGALKTAFDSLKYEWRGKPVGFVSYGGMSGGFRAVEQLRQVVAELHMVSVRDSVAIHQARTAFDSDGSLVAGHGAAIDAATRMLDQLHWWASATRVQRSARPYPRR